MRPCANKKIFYNIFILQACAERLENYFRKIDSLHSATTFVPRKFLIFIPIFIHCKALKNYFKMPQRYHSTSDQDRERVVECYENSEDSTKTE